VNFQNDTADPIEGYLPDNGEAFGDRGNGYNYGWDVDNVAAARNRNNVNSPDERYDTFNHLQKPLPAGRFWEIEVPNGRYQVYVVVGESNNIDSLYDLTAEGVTIAKGTPTDAVRWFDGQGIVTVTDGRLTLGNGPTASNNKVCFVDIFALPAELPKPVLAMPTISAGLVTVTWTNGGTLESAPTVLGPWTSTGDGDGAYTTTADGPSKFFRVKR
jgi:pectate lyase